MNEHDPSKREHINFSPLVRFKADIGDVQSFADLYISVTRYLTDEFNINDYYVDHMFVSDDAILPTPEMFEQDPRIAREQARLMLIKLALPIAENVIEDNDSFTTWTKDTAGMVIEDGDPFHEIEKCMQVSQGSTSHSCPSSAECPIKFTAYMLISGASRANMDDLDYRSEWADIKIARTIAKIEVARDLGLFKPEVTKVIKQSYMGRCYLRSKGSST